MGCLNPSSFCKYSAARNNNAALIKNSNHRDRPETIGYFDTGVGIHYTQAAVHYNEIPAGYARIVVFN